MSANLATDTVSTGQASKEATINTAIGQLDAALTEALIVDCTTDAVVTLLQVQRNIRIHSHNVPSGGKSMTLAACRRAILISADSANLGNLSVIVGSTTIVLTAGSKIFAYMDGTANGIETIVSSIPTTGTLSTLTDVNVVDGAPTDGKFLKYDNATSKWIASIVHGIPAGGTSGQVLKKASGTDYDYAWAADATGGGGGGSLPTGGSTGQVLTKDSSTDGDASWHTPSGGGGGGSLYELGPFSPPTASDYTPDSSGIVLVDYASRGMTIISSGTDGAALKAFTSTTNWTVTARIVNTGQIGQYPVCALFIFDSVSDKGIFFGAQGNGGGCSLTVQALNHRAYNYNPYLAPISAPVNWLRIVNDAGTLHFLASSDGIIFTNVYNMSITGFLGNVPDNVGFYVFHNSDVSSGAKYGGLVTYYSQTTTADYGPAT